MALNTELMARGVPTEAAKSLGDSVATGLAGAGSSQTDALVLTASISVFSTVNSSTGAPLPTAVGKPPYTIYNGGSNALTVYPNGSETINGTTSFSVTNGKSAIFTPMGKNWIGTLSA